MLTGGLAAALQACNGKRMASSKHIGGAIVDRDHAFGHRFRDGRLPTVSSGSARRRARVLVIGGGIAGLSACWRLQRAGVEGVELLELSSEIGGTARGGTMNGLRHPWGAHYLPVPRQEQRALATLLFDLGLADRVEEDGRLHVPMEYRVRAPQERIYSLGFWEEGLWLHQGEAPREREERLALHALLERIGAPDEGGRPFELPLARSTAKERGLDTMSAAAWAEGNGLTSERMRWYLEYAARDDFGAGLEDTSAWALVHYFMSRLSNAGQGAEYMSWPEGNAWLVARMRDALEIDVHTGCMCTAVRIGDQVVEIDVFDVQRERTFTWEAEHVVLATPQYVNARLLRDDPAKEARRSFRYSPWVVANLHLEERPLTRGFPQAWDNVLYHSESLGYVDAAHQIDRAGRDTVWTWYLPVTDSDERTARHEMLRRTWEDWRDLVLGGAHPGLLEVVTRIDVRRFGHAMIKPVPGFLWGEARQAAVRPIGHCHFAHSDLSGMAIFEEAHWQGVRAAEEICRARGLETEALA